MAVCSRGSHVALAFGVALLLVVCVPRAVRAEPEIYQRLDPMRHWAQIADDPAKSDSVWAGVAAMLPTFTDSTQRAFGWYLMYSAAQSLGRLDSMRVAAESSFVYSPHDPVAPLEFARYLGRAGHHLELAEELAQRAFASAGLGTIPAQRVENLKWLGYIQARLGKYELAATTYEQAVAELDPAGAWLYCRLGNIYKRLGQPERAIDRLTLGLSSFPIDSAETFNSGALLDSLVKARGGDVHELHTRITHAQLAAKEHYWLGSHRAEGPVPRAKLVELGTRRAAPSQAKSGITVVYAWATWCGPCRHSLPVLQEWAKAPRTLPIHVVTLNADGDPIEQALPNVAKFVAEQKLTLSVLLADSVAAAAWKLEGFPCTFVLKDGKIAYREYSGQLVEGLEAELESLGSRRVGSR